MASPSAVAASGLFLMENHLALDMPETLEIYEETAQGPQQKSSANLRAMSQDLIWMHITQEEYHIFPEFWSIIHKILKDIWESRRSLRSHQIFDIPGDTSV